MNGRTPDKVFRNRIPKHSTIKDKLDLTIAA